MRELDSFLDGSKTLRSLPAGWRVLLTLFLLLIAMGYLMALGNLYYRFELADTRPGLSLDDLTAHFRGLEVDRERPATTAALSTGQVLKSRMLEMVEPGGDMYKHLAKGGAPAVRSLTDWLTSGAPRETFASSVPSVSGLPAPKDVIRQSCLRCHNAQAGEKHDTPYGPDLFTVEYELVCKFARPGTARTVAAPVPGAPLSSGGRGGSKRPIRVGPQSYERLFLVAHVHMLSIPVFVLIVSGLFLLTDCPRALKGLMAVLPLAALVVDFAAWWLARVWGLFTCVIGVSGAIFGASLALQLLVVLRALWFGRARWSASTSCRDSS